MLPHDWNRRLHLSPLRDYLPFLLIAAVLAAILGMALFVVGTRPSLRDMFAIGGLLLTAATLFYLALQISYTRSIDTIFYATQQLDRLDERGVRRRLRDAHGQPLTSYVDAVDEENRKSVIQDFLAYGYALNRIGALIRQGVVDERILFEVWAPEWFISTWQTFEGLIEQEATRREIPKEEYLDNFRWLAERKCPPLVKEN